jgi:hypothetical protein
MLDEEEITDPMAAQFFAMLKAMPDDALYAIYGLIENELSERGVLVDEDAATAD